MASFTMTASLLGGSASSTTLLGCPKTTTRRGVVMAKASRVPETHDLTVEESNSKRRDLMFSAAAAAVCSVAKIAMADEEPKRGSAEAKKKYAPICVAMPTAKICYK